MNREEYISILETDNASYKKENKKLQSNWNSLREWLEILINSNLYSLSFKEPLRNVLDKMNELEGKSDD